MSEETDSASPGRTATENGEDYRQAYEQAQAQLMAYARDLALAYAAQKQMARYLPSDLRDRITTGSHSTTGERREVAVLVADLVDFTKLSSRMDVEDVFSLVNACFRRLVSHIFKHGGMVDKFLGDGIMAVFGASDTHEDDPYRAVKAALDMQAEIREFSQEMLPRLGVPLQLHIGVEAGQAIAGSVGVAEQLAFTVMGTTVNLAFRLQELAEAGTVLVGQNVYGRTADLFDYRYLGEFELKGIGEPVHVYHAQERAILPSTEKPTGRMALPFVGRERELDTLTRLSQRLATGEGGTVLITGPQGVGKTRLVREWLTGLRENRITVWTSQSDAIRQHISYSLWRRMNEKVFPIPSGDKLLFESEDSCVWASWGGALPPAAVVLTQVYNQPSQMTPVESRAQAFAAMRERVIARAAHAPVLIVVDECMRGDDISRQLLASLLPLADQYPVLFCLVGSEAPAEDDWSGLLRVQAGERYTHFDLQPLSDSAIRTLLGEVVDPSPLAPGTQAAIAQSMNGNPLALRMTIHALLASGTLTYDRDLGAVVGAADAADPHVTESLAGLVKMVIDTLPNYVREMADYASVIGRVFTGSLLRALISLERPAKDLANGLAALIEHGIIEHAATEADTFVFRHAAFQEGLYAGLPPNRAKVLHRALAEHLVSVEERGKAVDVELIAYHFLRAGLPAASVPYLVQAAKLAQRQAATQLSIAYHLAALEALENAPVRQSERLGLEISLASTYVQSRQYDQAIAHYQAALTLCRQDKKSVELHMLLGRTYAEQGNLSLAWAQLEEALETLSRASIPAHSLTRGRVYADCAQLQWRLGNESQADLWAREALAILEGTQEKESLNASYQTLSHVYAKLGQHSLAAHYAAKATGSLQPVFQENAS